MDFYWSFVLRSDHLRVFGFINAKANPEDFQDSPRPINNVNYGENGAMIRMTTDDPRSPYVYFPIKDLYMHFKNRML